MTDTTATAPESQPAKKTPVRFYRVNDTLVEASTPAQATHHYAKRTISTRVATQEDIVELLNLGVQIQKAGHEWIESPKPTKRVEIVAGVFVDPGAAKAMTHAAEEAASVPGAAAGDIEGAALAAVRIEPKGRSGLRITLAEDPAVLGAGDPAVLTADELGDIEDELGEAGLAERFGNDPVLHTGESADFHHPI